MKHLIVALTIFISLPIVSNAQWEADMRLSDTLVNSINPNTTQGIAAHGDVVHAVWFDQVFGISNAVKYIRSTDAGATWSAIVGMSSDTTHAVNATIATSANTVHVVWATTGTATETCTYRRSTDNGATWEETRIIASITGLLRVPAIASSGPNVYINWRQDNDGNSEIYFIRSTDNGATWSAPLPLTNDPGYAKTSSIAASGNKVYNSWRDVRNQVPGIFIRRSTDQGTTWDEEVRVAPVSDSTLFFTNISAAGNALHLVWYDNREGNTEIYYVRSLDGGQTFEPEVQFTTDAASSVYPYVVAHGSIVHVFWIEGQNGFAQLFYKKSVNNGDTWDEAMPISQSNARPSKVLAAVADQKLHIVTQDPRDGLAEMFYQRNVTGNSITGVEEIDRSGIVLLPSPATDVLSITSTDIALENITILNIMGQVIQTHTTANPLTISLNISELPLGMYVAQLYGKGQTTSRLFAKK